MTHRDRRQRHAVQGEMNLTSLIDVVFILLIAFMIVAPALKHGLDVDLAEVDEGTEALNQAEPITIVLALDAGDTAARIHWQGDEVVTLRQLGDHLDLALDRDPDVSVLIEPAASVPSETTLQVLGMLLERGVANYGFVTETPAIAEE